MFLKLSLSRTLTVLMALALSACAADKTADEYNNKKVNDDLQKVRSVAGTYSGLVFAPNAAEPLGVLTLDVSADSRVDSSDKRKAVINANIELNDGNRSYLLNSVGGYYDPYTQAFEILIPVSWNAVLAEVNLQFVGTIGADTLAGTLQASDLSGKTFIYSLTKNGTSDVQRFDRSVDAYKVMLGKTYFGKANITPNSNDNVSLVLGDRILNSKREFAAKFLAVKPVQITFNIMDSTGGRLVESFGLDGEYDERFQRLRGWVSRTNNGQTFTVEMECKKMNDVKTGWDCSWSSSSGAQFRFVVRER